MIRYIYKRFHANHFKTGNGVEFNLRIPVEEWLNKNAEDGYEIFQMDEGWRIPEDSNTAYVFITMMKVTADD